nr:GNAT family protein [Micromonospora globispora]
MPFRTFDAGIGGVRDRVWLAPGAEGQGPVTRAARRMIEWVVDERGMARIEWLTVPDNERSRAVARRLGMTRNAALRSAFPFDGERFDVEVWSLPAHEWRTAPGDRGEVSR